MKKTTTPDRAGAKARQARARRARRRARGPRRAPPPPAPPSASAGFFRDLGLELEAAPDFSSSRPPAELVAQGATSSPSSSAALLEDPIGRAIPVRRRARWSPLRFFLNDWLDCTVHDPRWRGAWRVEDCPGVLAAEAEALSFDQVVHVVALVVVVALVAPLEAQGAPCASVAGTDIYCGDVNADGVLDPLDVLELAELAASSSPAPPCADVNSDGVVSVLDALLVARKVAGLPASLACP